LDNGQWDNGQWDIGQWGNGQWGNALGSWGTEPIPLPLQNGPGFKQAPRRLCVPKPLAGMHDDKPKATLPLLLRWVARAWEKVLGEEGRRRAGGG